MLLFFAANARGCPFDFTYILKILNRAITKVIDATIAIRVFFCFDLLIFFDSSSSFSNTDSGFDGETVPV